MRNSKVLFGALVLGLGLGVVAACSSPPTPDPDNGVSSASYRQCVTKTYDDVCDVESRMEELKEADLARAPEARLRPESWWLAHMRLVKQMRKLQEDTLAGSKARTDAAPGRVDASPVPK